jgi:hypothetical protein
MYAVVRTYSGAGAKEWIEEHASELSSKLPTIDLGSVLVQIT